MRQCITGRGAKVRLRPAFGSTPQTNSIRRLSPTSAVNPNGRTVRVWSLLSKSSTNVPANAENWRVPRVRRVVAFSFGCSRLSGKSSPVSGTDSLSIQGCLTTELTHFNLKHRLAIWRVTTDVRKGKRGYGTSG